MRVEAISTARKSPSELPGSNLRTLPEGVPKYPGTCHVLVREVLSRSGEMLWFTVRPAVGVIFSSSIVWLGYRIRPVLDLRDWSSDLDCRLRTCCSCSFQSNLQPLGCFFMDSGLTRFSASLPAASVLVYSVFFRAPAGGLGGWSAGGCDVPRNCSVLVWLCLLILRLSVFGVLISIDNGLLDGRLMPIQIRKTLRIIPHNRVQIQRLRIRQVRIRHRHRHRRPVRRQKPPIHRRIIPRIKIIVPRLRVPLLPRPLVILRTRVRHVAFRTVRVKIRVVASRPRPKS